MDQWQEELRLREQVLLQVPFERSMHQTQQASAFKAAAIEVIQLESDSEDEKEAEEKLPEPCRRRIMESCSQEVHVNWVAAVRALEFERKRRAENEEERRMREEWEETQRKEREKEEVAQLENLLEQLTREEREEYMEVERRRKRVLDMEIEREAARDREMEQEAHLVKCRLEEDRKEFVQQQESLLIIQAENAARDRAIDVHRSNLRLAEAFAGVKREARKKATRDLDEHPHFQSLRYSRACTICANENPRQRVVLVPCGHMLCSNCPDQLEKPSTSTVICPFCRKETSYVRIFEDLETSSIESRKKRKKHS